MLYQAAEQIANSDIETRSYFNKNWDSETVTDAVNSAYKDAYSSNSVPSSGEYIHNYNYNGENIQLVFREGQFKTAYGDYNYTIAELLALLS